MFQSQPPECPCISIIIPVYNAGPYLGECLDSLLSQTFQDWEAICIDDGSSDESPALLDKCAAMDPRFQVDDQPNGGVSNARNRGLEHSRAPYLLLVDSDDWLEADALEQLYGSIRENGGDLVIFGHYFHEFHRPEPRTCLPWFSPSGPEKRKEPLGFRSMTRITSYACDKLFRSSIIREQGMRFQEGVGIGEDLKFILEYLGYSQTILFINRPFYHYRYGARLPSSQFFRRCKASGNDRPALLESAPPQIHALHHQLHAAEGAPRHSFPVPPSLVAPAPEILPRSHIIRPPAPLCRAAGQGIPGPSKGGRLPFGAPCPSLHS